MADTANYMGAIAQAAEAAKDTQAVEFAERNMLLCIFRNEECHTVIERKELSAGAAPFYMIEKKVLRGVM